MMSPHAVATLSDAVPAPTCGMYTSASHSRSCFSFMPAPSLPIITAVGPANGRSATLRAPSAISTPTSCAPSADTCALHASRLSKRLTGTRPALMAATSKRGMPTTKTWATPKAAAEVRMSRTLGVLPTLVSTRYSGGAGAPSPAAAAIWIKVNHAATMSDDMDQSLMTFVNWLGCAIFVSIVGYHFVTSSPKDAE